MRDEIIIRDGTENDLPFFYNSFLHHYKHGSPHTKYIHDINYYNELHNIVTRCLDRKGNVLKFVALKSDPDIVLGYIWANVEIETIYYVYIKKAFREMGIAKILLQHVFPCAPEQVFFPFWTYSSQAITQKYPNLYFNPYLLDRQVWSHYQSRFEEEAAPQS